MGHSRFLPFDPRVHSTLALESLHRLVLWIELMHSLLGSNTGVSHEQVYLLERDAGLLCRILGLYSARSLDIQHVEYSYSAQSVMKLSVSVAVDPADVSGYEEAIRVLVARATTLVGVIAAAEPPEQILASRSGLSEV